MGESNAMSGERNKTIVHAFVFFEENTSCTTVYITSDDGSHFLCEFADGWAGETTPIHTLRHLTDTHRQTTAVVQLD